jgi:hypothetical protein
MTSNEHYRGLNRKFDKRCRLLRSLGFQWQTNDYGAFFTRRCRGKLVTIPSCYLSLADNRTWFDKLASILSRGV